MSHVAVFGLGKLGQPMAVVLANAGHNVIGYDVDEAVRTSVGNHQETVDEPFLSEEMATCSAYLSTADTVQECVDNSEIGFVIVPTPSIDDGSFTNKFVLEVVTEIGAALKGKTDYYTVVICSTVMPGSISGEIADALTSASGRPLAGHSLGLVYSPQFIALGTVLHDMRNPDVFLIGTEQVRSGRVLAGIADSIHESDDVNIAYLAPTEAEIVKIGINTYITMKISFANALGQVCARIPGVDGYEVTRNIGLDSRIGSKYITAGGPYGGPCFPRDTVAYTAFVESVAGDKDLADLSQGTAFINDVLTESVAATAVREAEWDHGDILILGTAYKADSPVTEASYGTKIAELLDELLEYRPLAHDSHADIPESCNPVTLDELEALVAKESTVTIICTPDPAYADLWYNKVIDVWGIVPDENASSLINFKDGNGNYLLSPGLG